MSIFNEFFKKEKPVFTGLKFGFGSGPTGADSVHVQGTASGGVVSAGVYLAMEYISFFQITWW